MSKLIFSSLIIFSFSASLFAQEAPAPLEKKFTISGYVKEEASGETMIGANVYIKELMKGTQTNAYGFYSLTLSGGNFTLVTSYVGFLEQEIPVTLDKDLHININLKSKTYQAQEVVIEAERKDRNVESIDMSRNTLEVDKIKTLPAFMGEVDILKTIQLLPGVLSAGEGNSGYYVRGGGPDQNLVLLDEAVVYNASHLFGFFSVFNADAVKSATLSKGAMPARYGGRLSSVLDISMKDGNMKEYHAEGGIGFIASRLTVQGPIKKDTCSFIVSARRTFIDLFLRKPFIRKGSNVEGNSYYFYDLNTKINYKLSDKDRLFLSGYFGRDVFTYKSPNSSFKVNVPWGNATGTLRWNHLFSDKLFLNTSLIFTDYNFEFDGGQQEFEFKLFSGITDYNAKIDFNYFPSIKHDIRFGTNYTFHEFVPSNASARSGDVTFNLSDIIKQYAHDAAVYLSDDYDFNEKLRLSEGLRYTYFQQVGPFKRFVRNALNQVTDTIHYGAGENVKTYSHIESRFAMRWALNSRQSLKASYTKNFQYIHLASLSSVSLPTDVWVPSSEVVKPQDGTQYSIGYFRNFSENVYETSLELYYKKMKNQIEYRDGALPEDNVNDNADNNFTFGEGWGYGAELFLKKASGRWTGWIGYTLAWTKRKFPELNMGKEFYAKYDRRHDASVVVNYELNKKWTFGLTWVYATGNALTLPVSRYFINGNIVYEYGERNGYRMDAYHRLDISATLYVKKKKRWESSWNFSIFNVYNRLNPYFIYFDDTGSIGENNLRLQAKQVSLFPLLPSVTYNFKF